MLPSVVLRNDWEINAIDHAKSCQNVPRPSVQFQRLLIGYISKCKDRLSISILASISQPYFLAACEWLIRLLQLCLEYEILPDHMLSKCNG